MVVYRRWLGCGIACLLAIACPPLAAAECIDRIVAIINGEIVLLSEVDTMARAALAEIPPDMPLPELTARKLDIRKHTLDSLIEERLVHEQVRERKISITDEDVDRELKNLMEINHMDETQFQAALQREGKGLTGFRTELRTQLEQRRLFGMDIQGKIQIGEKDVENYYQTQFQSQQAQEKIHASHLLVPLPESPNLEQDQAARARAEALYQKILKGQSFEQLIETSAGDPQTFQGGDLGWFRRGDMVSVFEKVAFSLQPNEVSAPVKTHFGYHLIKLLERSREGAPPLEKVRDEIRARLQRERYQRAVAEWIEDLRRRSAIEIKL